MQGDPRWITARKDTACLHCKRTIRKGGKIFFYPNTQSGYCTEMECGMKADREFEVAQQDDGF